MTPAERKARHDARKRAAGLVPVLLWTRPENKVPLRELAKLKPKDFQTVCRVHERLLAAWDAAAGPK